MNSVGKTIAKLRKDHQMTQEEFAAAIGVSAQAISKWENEISMPDIMLLPVIAELFEVTIDELFYGCQKQEKKARAFSGLPP